MGYTGPLADKDRIFTNLYGFQDAGLKAAQQRERAVETTDVTRPGDVDSLAVALHREAAIPFVRVAAAEKDVIGGTSDRPCRDAQQGIEPGRKLELRRA